MKKISLVLCASMIVCSTWAQNSSFGIKGGLNVSTLSDKNDELGSRIGYHAGLLAHVHLSRQIAIQPEIVYSSQGAKYTVADGVWG